MPRYILIVDTSVFLNVLDIYAFNQHHDELVEKFRYLIKLGTVSFLLPLVSIIEGGNHIAQLSDGGQRRQNAIKYQHQVQLALNGGAPWQPTKPIGKSTIEEVLSDFPNQAMAGLGTGDLCILEEYNQTRRLHPHFEVGVWSIDHHLYAYGLDIAR